MSIRFRARSVCSNVAFGKPADHIWISDQLLAQTFNRFCAERSSRFKRHGSNVPGPLEAQRRLSRRRMNNISVGREVAPYPPPPPPLAPTQDGFLDRVIDFFGAPRHPPPFTWEPPWPTPPLKEVLKHVEASSLSNSKPLSTEAKPDLSSSASLPWLFPFGAHSSIEVEIDTAKEILSDQENNEPDTASDQDVGLSDSSDAKYEKLLSKVDSYVDMLSLHQEIPSIGLAPKERSMLEFQHLLNLVHGNPTRLKDCFFFLKNARLNIASGENCICYIDYIARHVPDPLTSSQRDRLVNTVRRAARDRQITPLQLIPILKSLLIIIQRGCGVHDAQYFVAQRAFISIAEASSSHSDFRSNKDAAAFFRELLEFGSRFKPTYAAKKYISKILQMSIPLYKSDFPESLEEVLARCTSILIQSPTAKPLKANQGDPWLVEILNKTEAPFVFTWVLTTTKFFVNREFLANIGIRSIPVIMDPWLAALRACTHLTNSNWDKTWRAIYSVLSKNMRLSQLSSHFPHVNTQARARILMQHWLTKPTNKTRTKHLHKKLLLPFLQRFSFALDGQLEVPKEFTKTIELDFQAFERQLARAYDFRNVSAISTVAGAVHTGHLFPKCFDEVIRLFRATEGRYSIGELCHVLARLLPETLSGQVVASVVGDLVKTSPIEAHRLFRCDKRIWLSQCRGLLQALVRDSNLGPLHILKLLDRHDPRAYQSHRFADKSAPCLMSRSRIRQLHALAREFSLSKRLGQRARLDAVYACYKRLTKANAPVYHSMSRALIRTGLLQPLQMGDMPSPSLAEWLYRVHRRSAGVPAARAFRARIASKYPDCHMG